MVDPVFQHGSASSLPPTQELQLDAATDVPRAAPTSDLDPLFNGESDVWPERGPAKGLRITWPVAALLVVLVAGGGIWGGAYLQRHQSSPTSSLASLFGGTGRLPGATSSRSSALGGFAGTAASGTTGTVTDISGNILYITDASGNLVTVSVNSSSSVDRNAKSTLSALAPGDSVTVQGSKASNGTIDASSISATQSGVSASSGLGGFAIPGS